MKEHTPQVAILNADAAVRIPEFHTGQVRSWEEHVTREGDAAIYERFTDQIVFDGTSDGKG